MVRYVLSASKLFKIKIDYSPDSFRYQIMSIFSIFPPLLSVAQLFHNRCTEFSAFVRNLRPSFTEGLRFLVTKSPNPWIHYWESDKQRKEVRKRSTAFIFERHWLMGTINYLLRILNRFPTMLFVNSVPDLDSDDDS
jgi:hypothetical protein